MDSSIFEKSLRLAYVRQGFSARRYRLLRKERIPAIAVFLFITLSFLTLRRYYQDQDNCLRPDCDSYTREKVYAQTPRDRDGRNNDSERRECPEQDRHSSEKQQDAFGGSNGTDSILDTSDTTYIEVLGNNYKPKIAAMPSWLPKGAQSSANTERLTAESQLILKNNGDVAPYTSEPDADSILILTPLKNNAKHLARYFALLDKIRYPRNRISLAFLVSDSTDNTQQMLVESRQWYQEKAPVEVRFKRFEIYRQDFFYSLPRSQRHLRNKQRERRTMMARARNYLWTRALQTEQWVLWIDGDLEYYPPNIVRDLMVHDRDVIVPNCLVRRKAPQNRWKHSVYDRNAWQETPKSLNMIKKLKEDDFLVEGYKSLKTHRKYLDNFSKNETIVPLDGVGGTFTLVKSHVHRSGVGFPAWLFQHQVETEGFAKLAKAHGYGVFGLPFYYIRHVVG